MTSFYRERRRRGTMRAYSNSPVVTYGLAFACLLLARGSGRAGDIAAVVDEHGRRIFVNSADMIRRRGANKIPGKLSPISFTSHRAESNNLVLLTAKRN